MSPTPHYPEQPPERSGLKTALVAGALIALAAANVYMYVQLDHMRTDLASARDSIKTELASLRDSSSVTTADQKRHIESLQQELKTAREQSRTFSSQAKAEAEARAEQLAKQLAAEQARAQEQLSTEITGVKQASDSANTALTAKITDVNTDVGGVKTQLSSTQQELQKTITQLKSVQGDLGVQSGLIATNGNELQALKLKGERNYIDIKLGKTKQPVRFADVTLLLKRADPKHNRFSVDVMADDKMTEKKDKNINEPVQFYTAKGGHTPYELVINKVDKDQIIGYLATPKDQAAR